MPKLSSVLRAHDRKIKKIENRMRKQKEKLARLRRKRPKEPVSDYKLAGPGGKAVTLASLFGKKKELILIHNMGASCPYCTTWADGFNGLLLHLENRAAFAVESPDRPASQSRFAKRRGWTFKMVSSRGSSIKKDLGFAEADGSPIPGISTFIKDRKGRIFRVAHTRLGPGDNYCILWDFTGLLPESDWVPGFSY